MNVYKTCGYILPRELWKGLLDIFIPSTKRSVNWKHWVTVLDSKTCLKCQENRGRICRMEEIPDPNPPLHFNCRCEYQPMQAVEVGKASKEGQNGADWWIRNIGILPPYYLTEEELENLGWQHGKSPKRYAPGKMLTGGIYRNDDKHLPDAFGRIWYEADLNYYEGKRNMHRLVWSNDGLAFVTYDHYLTFYELTDAETEGVEDEQTERTKNYNIEFYRM